MLRYVLLSFIAHGCPPHGYALTKRYRQRTGVRLSIGNVYRELQRLAAEGLIAAAANPPDADPRRVPYAITDEGRATLTGWLGTPLEPPTRGGLEEVSYRLAVLGDLDPAEGTALLDALHGALWDLAKAVERERAAAGDPDDAGGRLFAVRPTLLAHRAKRLGADIELVNELRAQLAKRRHAPMASERSRRPAAVPARRRRGSRGPGESP